MRTASSCFVASVFLACVVDAHAQCSCVGTTNRSLAFASGDVAQVPDPGFDAFHDFTVELWFRYTAGSQFASATLVHKRASQQPGSTLLYSFGVNGLGSLTLEAVGGFISAPHFTVTPNTWSHIAVTRQGSLLLAYLNGASLGAAGVFEGQYTTSTFPLCIGSFGQVCTTASLPLAVSVDELRIWNAARTQTQIQSTMASALVNAAMIPNLIGYWRFDESPAGGVEPQVFLDSSVTGINGVLGYSTSVETVDPMRSNRDFPPLAAYCGSQGNANTAAATLIVNGVGAVGAGPFSVTIPAGSTLTLSWSGTPYMPFVLAYGTLVAGCQNYGPTVGILDLDPATAGVLMNGLSAPGNLFFILDGAGSASQSSAVPPSTPPGAQLVDIQGAILQPSGFPRLTAAFRLQA